MTDWSKARDRCAKLLSRDEHAAEDAQLKQRFREAIRPQQPSGEGVRAAPLDRDEEIRDVRDGVPRPACAPHGPDGVTGGRALVSFVQEIQERQRLTQNPLHITRELLSGSRVWAYKTL